MLAAMIDGISESGATGGAGAAGVRRSESPSDKAEKSGNKNGANLASVLSIMEMCWGDVGLRSRCRGRGSATPRSPRSPTTSSWRSSPARGRRWRSPSPPSVRTRPTSAPPPPGTATSTSSTARRSTSPPASAPTVSWCGPRSTSPWAAPRSSRSSWRRARPGMRVERLEHKLGIRASDTAVIIFEDCRVPAENLLGSPEVDSKQGFAGAMATFDNTRPLVAAMAVGCARASLELTRDILAEAGVVVDYDGRLTRSRPWRRPSSSSRRTGRRPTCSRCSRPRWPTTASRTRWRPRWPRPRRAGWAPR